MKRTRIIPHLLLLLATLLAGWPMVNAVQEWMDVRALEDGLIVVKRPSARASDWVVWDEYTTAVLPHRGCIRVEPGYRGGIRTGDEFYALRVSAVFQRGGPN